MRRITHRLAGVLPFRNHGLGIPGVGLAGAINSDYISDVPDAVASVRKITSHFCHHVMRGVARHFDPS